MHEGALLLSGYGMLVHVYQGADVLVLVQMLSIQLKQQTL